MNLRISESQLRFRITQDELAGLMGGEQLESCIDLGTQRFGYRVVTNESDAPLAFSIQQGIWSLRVGKKAISEFAAGIPSREGIEYDVQLGASPITLVLEVDVRRSKKS